MLLPFPLVSASDYRRRTKMEWHFGKCAISACVQVMLLVAASMQSVHGISCGGNLVGSGRFTSPNYPGPYPNSANCQWHLTADEATGKGNAISLFVEFLEVEPNSDVLEIYSGGILMARYQMDTAAHKSVYSSNVSVVFRTDDTEAYTGFSIFFNSTAPECGTSCTTEGCTVWTPNFPYPFPRGSKCEWTVDTTAGFIAFDSTTVSATPFTGELIITSISNGSQTTDTYRSPAPIPTAAILGSSVTVNFAAQGCRNGTGFLLSLARKVRQCGGRLVGQGSFSTPNFPSDYFPNTICLWQLTAVQGQQVQLTVTTFLLENLFDYVRVYSDNQLVASYTGNLSPFTLTLGMEVTVEFKSDSNIGVTGFAASFISIP